jgi:hypothetical protein
MRQLSTLTFILIAADAGNAIAMYDIIQRRFQAQD